MVKLVTHLVEGGQQQDFRGRGQPIRTKIVASIKDNNDNNDDDTRGVRVYLALVFLFSFIMYSFLKLYLKNIYKYILAYCLRTLNKE